MNFILSFWGLLVNYVDFWEVWREVVELDIEVIDILKEINREGYETPLRLVAKIISKKINVSNITLEKEFVDKVYAIMKPKRCSIEFISWLRGFGKFGVLSNTQCKCFIKDFFTHVGIHPDVLVTSDSIILRKPRRSVFRYILKRIKAEPYNTIYIGDSFEDLGAMGVGMFTVIVGESGGHMNFSDLCEAWRWLRESLTKD
ncbi:MAG: HAD hydrolase-like protein [Pyrobaculum sp.]